MIEIKCTQENLRLIPIIEVVPNPRNNNRHSIEQINYLAKLIKAHGFREPLLISNRSGFLIAGHGRLEAAKLLWMETIPAIFQDFASEAEEYQHMTADNEIARWAELDYQNVYDTLKEIPEIDTELLGIENFVIPEVVEPQCDEDEVPEVPEEPKTKLGDIYKLGNHRLMCGDSTSIDAVEKLMDGNKADMVFTDPPYGINEETDRDFSSRTRKAKGNSFDKIIGDDSIDTAVAAYSISDLLAPIVCYWGGNYYAHKMNPSSCWIVWDKRVEEKQRDMNSDCELAYVKHPNKESVRIFRHLWKGMIKGSEHGQGRVHPTQKPIALAEWCFDELDKDSKIIVDLFCGSGSTLIACEKSKRLCFGMELSPKYCDVIVARWEKFTGKKAELING